MFETGTPKQLVGVAEANVTLALQAPAVTLTVTEGGAVMTHCAIRDAGEYSVAQSTANIVQAKALCFLIMR